MAPAKKKKKMTKSAAKTAYVQDTAKALILILIAVLIAISLVTDLIGPVGNAVKSVLFGLFGAGALLFPILLLFISALLFLKNNRTSARFIFGLLFILLFSAFFTVCAYTAPERGETAFVDYFGKLTAELWNTGYEMKSGGVLGGWLAVPLMTWCAKLGAGIIFAAAMAVLFILATGITFSSLFRSHDDYPEEKKTSKADSKAISRDIKTMRKDIDTIKKSIPVEEKKTKRKKEDAAPTYEDVDSILNEIERSYREKPNKRPKTVKKPESEKTFAEAPSPDGVKTVAIVDEKTGEVVATTAIRSDNTASLSEKELGELLARYGKGESLSKPAKAADISATAEQSVPPEQPEPLPEEPSEEELSRTVPIVTEPEKTETAAESVSADNEERKAQEGEELLKDATIAISEQIVPVEQKHDYDAEYPFPSLDLLTFVPDNNAALYKEELRINAGRLIETLSDFKIDAKVLDAKRGPTVTRYELQPGTGVKTSKIANLSDDIALHLAAAAVRIEAPIPGKSAIGIEIPNKTNSIVYLKEIIGSEEFNSHKSKIAVALGKDISGQPVVIDLAKMPHLLIAGVTGSGKSVCINSILISLLYKAKPDEVKLILVDPKVVELSIYNGIPHLLIPVVTDPSKAAGALNWAVAEMLQRYKLFADKGVRDFKGYNERLSEGEEKLPQIVIIIDELADLMMAAKGEIEEAICRLAQMARAAGMHLVIATQRPDSNVITGLIKANVPSHIAFAVSSQINSHIILDASGAEKLLGKGDMLYDPLGAAKPSRVQGCFVSDGEVEKVVAAVKNGHENIYDENIIKQIEQNALAAQKGGKGGDEDDDDDDPKLDEAIECVIKNGQASTSMLQRFVGLGYPRAAKIMDIMDRRGIIGPYQGSKPREVLITREQWEEMKARR